MASEDQLSLREKTNLSPFELAERNFHDARMIINRLDDETTRRLAAFVNAMEKGNV